MKRLRPTIVILACLAVLMLGCLVAATWIVITPSNSHSPTTVLKFEIVDNGKTIEVDYNEKYTALGLASAVLKSADTKSGIEVKDQFGRAYDFELTTYSFSNDANDSGSNPSDYPPPIDNVAIVDGGTYLATFEVKPNVDGATPHDILLVDRLVKYKSVEVGGTLYTIEDALNTAINGNAVVKYNTAFAKKTIADKAGYSVADGNYTVKSGVTLILPYNGKDFVAGKTESKNTGSDLKYETGINTTDGATGGSTFGVAGRKKIELTVPDNFILYNEGKIRVGGVTSGAQAYAGGTAGDYAQITLGANAVLESNGNIDIYGFIAEEENNNGSKLNMNSGTLRMTFRVVEHRGGSAYAAMVKDGLKGAPFNRYYMENCTAILVFKSTAHLLGYANLVASEHDNTTDIKLAGSGSDEMIQLQGDSYFTMKFNHATFVADIDIYGSFTLNSLQMSAAGYDVNMNQTYFPFSYLQQITLSPNEDNPATVDCTGQNLKLFPGANVKIEKNVTVNANNIVIYSGTYVDENKYGSVAAWKYPTENKGDGRLVVAGTLNAKEVGGNVLAEGDGARFISTENTITSYEILNVTGSFIFASASWSSYTNVLSGPVYYHSGNQEKQTLSAATYISKNGAWITDDSTFEVKYQFFACENEDGEKKAIVNNEGVNINNPVSYTHAGFTLEDPSYVGYEFVGWFTDAACMQSIESIDGNAYHNEALTLYGLFQKLPEGIVSYTLTLDGNGGEVNGQDSSVVSIRSTELDGYGLPQLTREGYEFLGWTKTNDTSDTDYIKKLEAADFVDGNAATLYAQWRIKNYDLKLEINTNTSLTVTVTTNGTDQDYSKSGTFKVPYGSTVRIKSGSPNSGYSSFTVSSDPTGLVTQVGSEFRMTENVTITTSATKDNSGCFAPGTMVMLADGSEKKVEDLVMGVDSILAFDHMTGQWTSTNAFFIMHRENQLCDTVKLYFSDGTMVHVYFAHGFFDIESNQYEMISPANVSDYVGHTFYKYGNGGNSVQLIAYETEQVYSDSYSIYTGVFVDHVINGMLAVSDDLEGLYNVFELDENMKYDEKAMQADIEKYGLYTYEEWADYCTEEEFYLCNVQYLKVALGKGLVTIEQIYHYFNDFLAMFH